MSKDPAWALAAFAKPLCEMDVTALEHFHQTLTALKGEDYLQSGDLGMGGTWPCLNRA